ncbi:MAG: polysaccharide biosynthesis protein [Caldilineales bacterium]|nr:polysaccharide biosynthesis protein [Caldilineales bacterium]
MKTLMDRLRNLWERRRQRGLVVVASAYVSGYVLQKGIGFLLIPIWARFLTPEDYGITGTLTAYAGVLSTILGLGLYAATVRHYHDSDDVESRKSYVSSIMLFQLVVAGIAVLAMSAFGESAWTLLTADTIPFQPYVPIVLWTTYIDLLIQIPLALYQTQQKAKQYVSMQYIRFGLGVLGSLLFVVLLRWGALGVLVSQLSAAFFTAIVVFYLFTPQWFSRAISFTYVRRALTYGLPLVPHAMAGWMLQSSDRIILERNVSLAELGLYNFGYTLAMSMQFLVYGINQAWIPFYYGIMKQNDNVDARVVHVVSRYVAVIGAICLAGSLFAGEVIQILMPSRYFGAATFIPPVMAGYFFLGLYYFASAPLFYHQKTRSIPLLTGSAAAVNILVNIWLVPRFGAITAAWSTLLAYALLLALALPAGRRYQQPNYPFMRYAFLVFMLIAGTVAASVMGTWVSFAMLAKALWLCAYIVAAYILLLKPSGTTAHA